MAAGLDPEGFAQRQLDAYNAHDLARFVAEYTEDVRVFNFPDPTPVMTGRLGLPRNRSRSPRSARCARMASLPSGSYDPSDRASSAHYRPIQRRART